MSKTLVLYKSKYGSTKQYAEWIAAELKADLCEPPDFKEDWEKYSKVIYCGGLYANRINGLGFIAKNAANLRRKKIVIVACGLSYPHIELSVARIIDGLARKLPKTIHPNVRMFMVRGSIKYSQLGFFEKIILNMLERTIRKKDPQTLGPEEQEMLSVLGRDFSFVDRSFIQPIIDYCRGVQKHNE